MSRRIVDLEESLIIDDQDEILFFQNSTKRTKKVKRGNFFSSRGLVVTGKFITPEGDDVGLTAEAAEQAALLAEASSEGAQASANSKSRVYYSATQPVVGVINGYISGTTLTVTSNVTAVISGSYVYIGAILTGGSIAANTKVVAGSGNSWTVSVSQTVGSSVSPIQINANPFVSGDIWYNIADNYKQYVYTNGWKASFAPMLSIDAVNGTIGGLLKVPSGGTSSTAGLGSFVLLTEAFQVWNGSSAETPFEIVTDPSNPPNQVVRIRNAQIQTVDAGKLTAGFIGAHTIELGANESFLQSRSFVPTWASGFLKVRPFNGTAANLGKVLPSDAVQVKVLQENGSYKLFNSLQLQNGGTSPATVGPPSTGGTNGFWAEEPVPIKYIDAGYGTTAIPDFGFRVVGNGAAEFTGALFRGAIVAQEGFFGSTKNGIRLDTSGLIINNFGRIKSAGIGYSGNDFFISSGTSGGFFLGNTQSEGTQVPLYQFFIGNPGGNNLRWNGTDLRINGRTISTGASTDIDNEYGITIGSNYGIRYYTNTGVLTMTGGYQNGALNAAQIDLAGNSWLNINRGALVLSSGKVTTPNAVFTGGISGTTLTVGSVSSTSGSILVGMTLNQGTPGTVITGIASAAGGTGTYIVSPSQNLSTTSIVGSAGTAPGAIHFRIDDSLVGLWRANKNFEIYSTLWVGGNLYAGNDFNNPRFSVNGTTGEVRITAGTSSLTINGATIDGTSSIGGVFGTSIAAAIGTSGDIISDVINGRLNTETKEILSDFSFGTSGAIQIGSYANGVSGDIKISPSGIVGRNSSGNTTFALNGSSGAATFAGELSAPSGNIGGFTISGGLLTAGTSSFTNIVGISGTSTTMIYAGLPGPDYFITQALFRVSRGGSIGARSGFIGGWSLGDTLLYSGSDSYTVGLSSNTALGNISIYCGASTSAVAPFRVTNTGELTATKATITGSVTASSGLVGGWTIGTSDLTGGSGAYGVGLKVGASQGDVSIYAGSTTSGIAPFRVTNAGTLTATNASISGTVTSSSGLIGGWTIGASTLTGGALNYSVGLAVDSGVGNVAIYAGNATKDAAPFKVTNTGVLTASNANITGTITSGSGSIGGWTLASSKLSAGAISIESTVSGAAIAATAIIPNRTYSIDSVGTTNFTSIGALSNANGQIFVATGVGTGNGTVFEIKQKIQVGPDASNYVRIDAGGILGVNSTLGTVFNLPTNGTRPKFSSGEIEFTKFVVSTSGIIATSNTVGVGTQGNAGVIINNTGIKGFKEGDSSPVFHLDAVNGNITAKGGTVGGWTLSPTTLTGGSVTVDSAGNIRAGKAGFANTDAGFWLGIDGTLGKFHVGNSSNYVKFDGSELTVNGVLVNGTRVGSNVAGTFQGLVRGINNAVFTINGGSNNGVQYGAQIDLIGAQYDISGTSGGNGRLSFQGAYNALYSFDGPADGSILFCTSYKQTTSSADQGVPRMMIHLDGTVEILNDTSSPAPGGPVGVPAPNGGAGKLKVNTSITVGNNITLTANSGDVTATQFTTSSSRRFKTKIKKLNKGIDVIKDLNPVSFVRKDNKDKKEIGFIAEEVNKILPEVVKKDLNNDPEGIDYSKLTVLLVSAIKELSAKINELELKLNANTN